MSKEKAYESMIPKMYRYKSLDIWMFNYVRGVKAALPTVSVRKAIEMFMKEYFLTEDQYSLDSAMTAYQVIKKLFLQGEY